MNRLLLMTGSIACAKATGLISEWTKQGDVVQIITSKSVFEFLGLATLEGLSQRPVMTDTFEPGAMMDHIHHSRWADQIILCPASANVINKIARGIADDVITTTWIAAYGLGKPMIIVPAMNSMMWQYPATQSSIKQLANWNVKVMPIAKGNLACGEQGEGRMPEVTDILEFVEQLS